MTIKFSGFTMNEYPEALALWNRCEGIGLSDADEFEATKAFLERNPGMSFIAREDDKLVGTCLCGTDGRRGYLYHLAVDLHFRRQQIGKRLVEQTLSALATLGINKCHIMVFGSNQNGLEFWKNEGWVLRPEIVLMSHKVGCYQEEGPC